MTKEPPIPILLYHKIGRPARGSRRPGQCVSTRLFRRHLAYLARYGYECISLLDVVRADRARPPRPVVITFDDGYRCLYEHALPALAELGWTATVFLVADGLGGTNAWEQAAGDVEEPLLGLAEIQEMRAAGLEFGSHTRSHPRLTELSEAEARAEIADSRARLAEALGAPCDSFAYPYGDWNPQVRDLVEEAGYQAACTTHRAAARRTDDALALPRINIRRYNILPRFAYKLWRAGRGGS